MATRSQADAHRRNVADLVRLGQNDLRLILARYDDPVRARDALIVALPKLADIYGSAAATIAADWYDDLRADHGARSRFLAIPATVAGPDRTDVLARWGVGPMFGAEPNKAQAFQNIAGGLQKIIADASRNTVAGSSAADRLADGWERITDGGCDYCQSLAGSIYSTEPEDGSFHTNCGCVAAPAFR